MSESYKIDIKRVASKLQVSEQAVSKKIRLAVSGNNNNREPISASLGRAGLDGQGGERTMSHSPKHGFVMQKRGKKSSVLSFGVPKMAASAPVQGADQGTAERFLDEGGDDPLALDSDEEALYSGPIGGHSLLSASGMGTVTNVSFGEKDGSGSVSTQTLGVSLPRERSKSRSPEPEFTPTSANASVSVISKKALAGSGPPPKKFTLLDTIDADPVSPCAVGRRQRSMDANMETTLVPEGSPRPTVTVHKNSAGVIMTVEEPWSPCQSFHPASSSDMQLAPPSSDDGSSRLLGGGGIDHDKNLNNDTTTPPNGGGMVARSLRDELSEEPSILREDPSGEGSPTLVGIASQSATNYGSLTGSKRDNSPSAAITPEAKSAGSKKKEKKKVKHVHFGEEAIKKINVVHRQEQIFMQVEYNRPVWTWLCMIVAAFCFVLCWTLLCHSAYPSNREGESVARSVALFSSILNTAPLGVILPILLFVWRPNRFERRALRNKRSARRLAACALSYGVAQGLFTGAFMCIVTPGNGVAFCVLPVAIIYMWEMIRKRIVSELDTLGVLVMFAGLITIAVGEAKENSSVFKWIGLALAIMGSFAEAMYRVTHRRLRAQYSNSMLLAVTQGCAAVISVVIALAANAFSAPIGSHRAQGLPGLHGDVLARTVASAILMLIYAAMHQYVAIYFDTITIAAWFATCGPLMVLFFHTMHLPHMALLAEAIGGGLLAAGCIVLVIAGWRHRRHIELAINVEAQEEET